MVFTTHGIFRLAKDSSEVIVSTFTLLDIVQQISMKEGANLGKYNIAICIFGVIYLVYSFLRKDKVTIYNRNDRMLVLNEEKFLKLQLYFSIVNSILMVILGLMITMVNLELTYILGSVLLFHTINYLLRAVAKSKEYIQFN
jgi:hypothetical protein